MKIINVTSPLFSSILISTLFLILLFLANKVDSSPSIVFLETHINQFSIRSSFYQKVAYLFCIFLLAFICLAIKPKNNLTINFNKTKFPFSCLIFACMFCCIVYILGNTPPKFMTGIIYGFFAFTVTLIIPYTKLLENIFNVILLIGSLFFIYFYYIIPLNTPIQISSLSLLASIESHYAVTLMPGFDINGLGIGRSNYGLGIPLFTSALVYFEKQFPQNISVNVMVRIYQILAAFIFLMTLFKINRRHFIFFASLGLILTPTLTNHSNAIFFPNQSGIRYLPFLIGIYYLTTIKNKNKIYFSNLIYISAAALVLSFDTGLALLFGLLSYYLFSNFDPNQRFCNLILKIFSFLTPVTLLYFILSWISSLFFYNNTNQSITAFFRLFLYGYGGLTEAPNTIACIIFFIATFIIISNIQYIKKNGGTQTIAYQISIAVMIICWLPYYVNRMDFWNLWFQVILLLYLLASLFNTSEFKSKEYRLIYAISLIFIFGLLFTSIADLKSQAQSFAYNKNLKCDEKLSSYPQYCFEPTIGKKLAPYLDFLSKIENKEDYLVFSSYPSLIHLLGFNKNLPWYDFFSEVPRASDLKMVTDYFKQNPIKYIMVDDPFSELNKENIIRNKQFELLLNDMKNYEKINQDNGIQIFRIKNSYQTIFEY